MMAMIGARVALLSFTLRLGVFARSFFSGATTASHFSICTCHFAFVSDSEDEVTDVKRPIAVLPPLH